MMRRLSLWVTGLGLMSLLLLAGCGPLISFGGDGAAQKLYILRYPSPLPADKDPDSPSVYVAAPGMAGRLDGKGVAVALPDNRNTVLEGVSWASHLSDQVRDYIIQSLSAETEGVYLGHGTLDIKAGCRLGVKVWAMELVPGAIWQEDRVHVSLQFLLVHLADNSLVGQQVFHVEKAPVGKGADSVMAAFNEAMKDTATSYSAWMASKISACH